MSCHEVQESLSDYLDEGLSRQASQELEKHLAECPACRAALAEMRRVDALLAGFADPPVDEERLDGLWARIEARLPEGTHASCTDEASYLRDAPLVVPTPAASPTWLMPVLVIGGVVTVAVVVLAVSLVIQRGRPEAGADSLGRGDQSAKGLPGELAHRGTGGQHGPWVAADMAVEPAGGMAADPAADSSANPPGDMAADPAADSSTNPPGDMAADPAADSSANPPGDMAAAPVSRPSCGPGAGGTLTPDNSSPGRRRSTTQAAGVSGHRAPVAHGSRLSPGGNPRPRPEPAAMGASAPAAMGASAPAAMGASAPAAMDARDSGLQALLQQAAGPMGGGGGGGGEVLPARLGPGDIRAGVDRVIGQARACYDRYRVSGTCQVRVVISGSTGRPTGVSVLGSFAGTSTGRCVEQAFGKARFRRFSASSQSFVFPLVFRK